MPDRQGEVQPSNGGEEGNRARLHKVLARAGVASRRASEDLIVQGRVSVNGEVVRRLGTTVDPETDVLAVDGLRVPTARDLVHLAVNKPRGVVSTMSDPEGRPCLGDLLEERSVRVFHVGRLDTDSEGLILATNAGELAHRLLHPSYAVPKTYLVEVDAPIHRDLGRRLRAGIDLEDGPGRVDAMRVREQAAQRVLLEITIHEGRNRIVRRLLEAAGHPVRRLVRTAVGPVQLGSLRAGRSRHLTRHEVGALYKLVDL